MCGCAANINTTGKEYFTIFVKLDEENDSTREAEEWV
jgi:hypothetical protein